MKMKMALVQKPMKTEQAKAMKRELVQKLVVVKI